MASAPDPGGEPAGEGAFRTELRAWLRDHVDPDWRERHRALPDLVAYLRNWDRALHAAGYACIDWPVEFGGGGASALRAAVFYEECARADAPDGLARIGQRMVGPAIMRCGTEAQRERHLPAILSAAEIWSQGFSEPEAGSDLASLRTRATRTATGWRLDGEKVWTTFAQYADWCFVLARTPDPGGDNGGGGDDGVSMFLVPLDSPGVTVRPLTTIAGMTEFNAVTFDAVPLPEDALLGPEAGGWPIIRSLLSRERSGYNSYRLLRPVRRGVERFVRMLGDQPTAPLADAARLYARALASHELVVDLLVDETSAEPRPAFGSLVKLFVTEAVRTQGRTEAGAFGDRERAALDEDWVFDVLDSMHYTISAGTSEIQRNIVASRMLRLPSSR